MSNSKKKPLSATALKSYAKVIADIVNERVKKYNKSYKNNKDYKKARLDIIKSEDYIKIADAEHLLKSRGLIRSTISAKDTYLEETLKSFGFRPKDSIRDARTYCSGSSMTVDDIKNWLTVAQLEGKDIVEMKEELVNMFFEKT